MAPHALIIEHLDLVPRLARKLRLSPNSSVWDDAIQAGRMGLIEAAARYDAALGAPFREYARKFVTGAIKDVLSADSVVRPSRHAVARGSSVDHVELDAALAYQRVPAALVDSDTEERAAADLDSARRVHELRAAVRELPKEQRDVIAVACSDGSVEEFARRKGIGRRTAYDHFEAAKAGVCASMAPHTDSESADIPTGAKVPRVT